MVKRVLIKAKEPDFSTITELVVTVDVPSDDSRGHIERAKDILSTRCAVCCTGLGRPDEWEWSVID